jgi:hydroxymethylglutaryl-CoA reductase (NADPH)
MVTIPGFLLRRLYVKGSLHNTERGVEFSLLNKLGAGYARKLMPLEMDGEEVPLQQCSFSVDGEEVGFEAVSAETPFTLDLNRSTIIIIRDVNLSQGPHKISMSFEVAGLGNLQFEFTDAPSDDG